MNRLVFDLQRFAVYGSYGNDTLNVNGSNSYVYGYSGNDYIYNNKYSYVKIDAGTGNDSIINNGYNKYVTIDGAEGNDNISTGTVDYMSVDGGMGNDSINIHSAWYSTINAGMGDDTVVVPYRAWQDSINGGFGDDKISLGSGTGDGYNGKNTIIGGYGNDTIWANPTATVGNFYQFTAGDGYDWIYNWNYLDTISLGGYYSSNYYTRSTVGSSVIISLISGGAMTLNGASGKTINIANGIQTVIGGKYISNSNSNSLLSGTSYNDTIINNGYNKNVTIDGAEGNDNISTGTVDYMSVDGGMGNDSINIHSAWYSTINAGMGDDTVVVPYRAWQDSINGGFGDDKISLGSGTGDGYNGKNTIIGGYGNDTIWANPTATVGNFYQFTAGDGYDWIYNWNYLDTISLGGDTYTRSTVGSSVIISLVSGGAMTLNGASGKTINITNGIQSVTTGGTWLKNSDLNSLVSGTSFADTIYNEAGGSTLRGDNGNDSIYSSTLYTVKSSYGYVTIDGGNGNDSIYSFDPYVSINGGEGADKISVYSSANYKGITINGGAGNDTIYGNSLNGGVLYQYNNGDGNDLIYGFTANDTLSISGSSYTTSTSGNDVLVKIGSSSTITLDSAKGKSINIYPKDSPTLGKNFYNTTSNTSITGTSYADTIKNNLAGGVTINAGAGNDSIYNYANKVTVNGGNGNDSLTGGYSNSKINGDNDNDLINLTGSYWWNTIDGGAGNDTIITGGSAHSVNGGAGADKISLSGDKLTVSGGTGNDTIYGSTSASHLYQYKKGDGNDIIYNYGSNDSITISGSTWTSLTSDNNILIKVANSGTITLNGAKGKTLNIYPAKKPDTDPTDPSDVSPQDVIKKFMNCLDKASYSGISALNQAVSVASGGYFTDVYSAIRQMVADCRKTNNATSFLKNYCDIDLSNPKTADTGAITGKEAGGSSVDLTPEKIVPESGYLDTSFKKTSFNTDYGVTFYLSKTSLSDDEFYIWRALKTWWANAAFKLIEDSYDYSFTDSDASVKNITVVFEEDYSSNGYLAYTGWPKYINGIYTRVLGINKAYYKNFESTDVNGESPNGQGYLDRTVAHELTHAIMMSKVSSFSDLPQFITEGTAELVHGIDDFRGNVISSLAGSSSLLESSLSLIPGTGGRYEYASGYMFLRYLAKQGSEHYGNSGSAGNLSIINDAMNSDSFTVKGSTLTVGKDFYNDVIDLTSYASIKSVDATNLAKGVMIVGNKKSNSIVAGSGNDTISGNNGNDTLRGGDGDEIIFGNAGNDFLKGETGNDTLYGGDGNDTLTGGDGADIFVHTADNDCITDYKAGVDKIKFVKENASVTSSSVSGDNVILTISGTDLITIKGVKNQEITFINYNGKETTSVYGGGSTTSTLLTVTNSTKSPVTVGSAIRTIDASMRTKAVQITGNSLANTIEGGSGKDLLYGGKGDDSIVGNAGADKLYGQAGDDILRGGKGNDSLWGGTGNDTLYGDDGADKFIYAKGDGNDVIYNFANDDMLKITGTFFTSYSTSKKEIYFKVGSTSNAITLRDFGSTSTFNINGTKYKLGGSKLIKK